MIDEKIAIYIHIPFCKTKCGYCDFNSYSEKNHLWRSYFEALKKEMSSCFSFFKKSIISSIFIGGGTPSYVDYWHIVDVLDLLFSNAHVDKNAEISIELNPGTINFEKLSEYKSAGINRISIGLQAFQNDLLKKLGRSHKIEDFLKSFELSHEVGFNNINVDLIFGIPSQTMNDWKETIESILEKAVTHVSCYSLKIEENTPFFNMLKNKEISPPDDELDREMYYFAQKEFDKAGFKHYEISNFAKAGYECRHNIVYWKCLPYIGFGAGAHSYFQGKRFNNVCNVEQYITGVIKNGNAQEDIEEISEKEAEKEFVMLGFRLIDGVDCNEFSKRFQKDIFTKYKAEITSLENRGLINVESTCLRLSTKGLDFANQVFEEFI